MYILWHTHMLFVCNLSWTLNVHRPGWLWITTLVIMGNFFKQLNRWARPMCWAEAFGPGCRLGTTFMCVFKGTFKLTVLGYFVISANWQRGCDVKWLVRNTSAYITCSSLTPGKGLHVKQTRDFFLSHLADYRQSIGVKKRIKQDLKGNSPVASVDGGGVGGFYRLLLLVFLFNSTTIESAGSL